MNKYELLVILSDTANEEAREGLMNKIEELLTSNGATIEATDKWGMKKFAYTIDFKNEGFYVLMNFEAPSTVVAEMNRNMNIADHVVRQMFVRK